MGVLKTITDFEYGLGTNVGNYTQEIAKSAAKFVCQVRSKYPRSFARKTISSGFLDSICRSVNVPQTPGNIAAFTGGQCVGVGYTAWGYQLTSSNSSVPYSPLIREGNLAPFFSFSGQPGRIVSCYIRDPSGNILDYASHKLRGRLRNDNHRIIIQYNNGLQTGNYLNSGWGFEITEFKRDDGLTDNCGNPSPVIPPDPPYNPNDFSGLITICDRSSTGDPINCKSVSVDIDQDDLDNLPICVRIDNIKVCIGPDGFTIEDTIEPPPSETPIDEIPIDELPKEELPEGDVEKDAKKELIAVIVSIKDFKTVQKIVTHKKADYSDHYAGYISWTAIVGGKVVVLETYPVRKLNTYYAKPAKAEAYTVYSTYGAKLQVTEVKEPPMEGT